MRRRRSLAASASARPSSSLVKRVGLALERCDQQLVRLPGRRTGRAGRRVALLDDADAQLALLREHPAEQAAGRSAWSSRSCATSGGSCSSQTSWEWVCGRLAPAPASLVHEGVDVREARLARGRRAGLPGLGDELELPAVEVGERADVPRRVDDDLLSPHRGRRAKSPSGRSPSRGHGPNAGNLFGTTRTRQPGVSGGRPGGRCANVSGGVADSRPSSNGQPTGSSCSASSPARGAPGRRARDGATTTQRPEIGSRRSSGGEWLSVSPRRRCPCPGRAPAGRSAAGGSASTTARSSISSIVCR